MTGYVTATEAAEQLACSLRTIKRMCEDGRLVGARVMNRWAIDESSIDAYLATLTYEQMQILDARRRRNEEIRNAKQTQHERELQQMADGRRWQREQDKMRRIPKA